HYRGRPDQDETEEDVRRFMEQTIQATRANGIGFQIEFARKGTRFHLLLWFGPRGHNGNVLCWFDTEELGLPLTRTNPYRLLEKGVPSTPPPDLPRKYEEPLAGDVTVAANARWEEALR